MLQVGAWLSAILLNIYCWLMSFWSGLRGLVVDTVDSGLSPIDSAISALDVSALGVADFSSVQDYLWILGATGVDICLGMIGAALVLKVTLQLIPFVRLGS